MGNIKSLLIVQFDVTFTLLSPKLLAPAVIGHMIRQKLNILKTVDARLINRHTDKQTNGTVYIHFLLGMAIAKNPVIVILLSLSFIN